MIVRRLYPWSTWLCWVLFAPLTLLSLGLVVVVASAPGELLFDSPELWWLGLMVPAAGLVMLYGTARRRRSMNAFASETLAPLLTERISPTRQAVRACMLVVAVLMITVGIIGPRWGFYLQKQTVYGVDVVVAIDVSRSMLARDLTPSRLEYAKRVIRQQLIERAVFRRANRLGLLAFAGSTSVKVPLTTDHLAFRKKLDMIQMGSAPRGGTAIAEAIRKATDLFAKSPEEATKIILLFTDGEDHDGGPVEAAAEALANYGVRTFTVGVGDPATTVGVQIPAEAGNSAKPLLHDGQIVFSKLDVAGLRKIADAGRGSYAAVKDFHGLVDALAGLKKAQLSTEERTMHKPRYQWFLAIALLLLTLEPMIRERGPARDQAPRRVWQQEFSV